MFSACNNLRAISDGKLCVLSRITTRSLHEDGGRVRIRIQPQKFISELMPLPKKKDSPPPLVDKPMCQYNSSIPWASHRPRFDEIFIKTTDKTTRRYSQTWVEGPAPVAKKSILHDLEKMADPAPIARRLKGERPRTAECVARPKPFQHWYHPNRK